MPTTLVLGAQWGDEGKGKLVDILAQRATLCCRAAGGNNAGHTIVVNDITYDFHILPSGLINPSCQVNLIGAGCVVHVPSFFKELDDLAKKGLEGVRERVLISDRAHICFDLHVAVDGIVEDVTARIDGGKSKIGTTRKGIGPCYSDKVARRGVPFWMLVGNGNRWESRLRDLEKAYRKLYGDAALQGYSLEDEISRFQVRNELLELLFHTNTSFADIPRCSRPFCRLTNPTACVRFLSSDHLNHRRRVCLLAKGPRTQHPDRRRKRDPPRRRSRHLPLRNLLLNRSWWSFHGSRRTLPSGTHHSR